MYILEKIYQNFKSVPSVFIDGLLYVVIAVMAGMGATFSSDEAAKYIDAKHLFYLKNITAWMAAGFLAMKMFRSTSFAAHQEEKRTGNTTVFTKQNL